MDIMDCRGLSYRSVRLGQDGDSLIHYVASSFQ